MKVLFCLIIIFCLAKGLVAQTAYNVVSTPNGLQYANPSALGEKNADSVGYADFKGSPFWKEEWMPAVFILNGGSAVKVEKARLNLYTNDVHYISPGGQQLVAATGNVNRIYFLGTGDDTGHVKAVFERFTDVKSKYNVIEAPFCQVLNSGKVQLLKLISVTLDKKMDLSVGKEQYSFQQTEDYYLLKDAIFFQVKKLNKDNVMAFVIPDADTDNWLQTNKNKLKSEKEVLAFLAYYNKTR